MSGDTSKHCCAVGTGLSAAMMVRGHELMMWT